MSAPAAAAYERPTIGITVTDIAPTPYAATPQLSVRLELTEDTGARVHAVALRCQVRIEPQRRPYSAEEEAGLSDLFGPRSRWSTTLKPLVWLQAGAMLPGFTGRSTAELVLPCTYDFEVAGSKYLHALRDGVVPLELQFAGTVYLRGSSGFEVTNLPWDLDVRHPLPVQVWRDLIDLHFPGDGWLRMNRDTIDALARYRAEHGLTSWEACVEELLALRQAQGASR